ncbi:MAG: hypothetical protein HY320_00150 [Armatimonadetes bacterium]|nr:hypothetical protein [Armatimonadota bacterium]
MQSGRADSPALSEFRRILVLNRSHIGDCLLTTPTLRALRRGMPRAHLGVSVPAANRDLLACNPHIDEIVPRPRRTRWLQKFNFALEIRQWKPDLVISFQEKSIFYALATWYQRSALTLSLDHPRTRRFYDYTVPIPAGCHEVEKYLAVADALGCARDGRPVLELVTPVPARESARRLLEELGADPEERFIAINPGGTKPEKRWPVGRFAEVAEALQRELGLRVLIIGGPSDVENAVAIAARCSRPSLIVAGRTTLGETAACLERCTVFVTGDTGPMHMAVALAVPVVSIFGPTNPIKFGPYTTLATVLRREQPCSGCVQPCIHTISAAEVIAAALDQCPRAPAMRNATRASS